MPAKRSASKSALQAAKAASGTVNFKDIPELDDDWFERATLEKEPAKVPVSLRMDPDVLGWFKNTGHGYQTRINGVLRSYMRHQQSRGSVAPTSRRTKRSRV